MNRDGMAQPAHRGRVRLCVPRRDLAEAKLGRRGEEHRGPDRDRVPGKEPFEDRDNHTCDALKELIAEEPTHERFEPYIEDTDPDSPFYRRDDGEWSGDPEDAAFDEDDPEDWA